MKKIKIAIDGYSGTGKSSTAREVAHRLHYTFIDSGAMYRAVTYQVLNSNIEISDKGAIITAAKELKLKFPDDGRGGILINGDLITTEIREPRVNENVSAVAAITEVRREMVRQQQEMANEGGIVMDGRDIGTMVFPDAELKVFMRASTEVRARRRQKELFEQGIDSDLESIKRNLIERDSIDSTRSEGPLRKAAGALEIDTSNLNFEEQVALIVKAAKEIIDED